MFWGCNYFYVLLFAGNVQTSPLVFHAGHTAVDTHVRKGTTNPVQTQTPGVRTRSQPLATTTANFSRSPGTTPSTSVPAATTKTLDTITSGTSIPKLSADERSGDNGDLASTSIGPVTRVPVTNVEGTPVNQKTADIDLSSKETTLPVYDHTVTMETPAAVELLLQATCTNSTGSNCTSSTTATTTPVAKASHFYSSAPALVTALIFALLFTLAVLFMIGRRWVGLCRQPLGYQKADYLINGMYT